MTTTTEPTESVEPINDQPEQAEDAIRRSNITMYLANNILNNVPLSKIVELVKTAAMNDARKLVESATEEQLSELEAEMQDRANTDSDTD